MSVDGLVMGGIAKDVAIGSIRGIVGEAVVAAPRQIDGGNLEREQIVSSIQVLYALARV